MPTHHPTPVAARRDHRGPEANAHELQVETLRLTQLAEQTRPQRAD